MKVIVNIPKEVLEHPHNYCCYALANQIKGNYTPIPDNATNGDVIKIMYPDIEVKPVNFDGKLIGYNVWNLDNVMCETYFTKDFWNASYQKEVKE